MNLQDIGYRVWDKREKKFHYDWWLWINTLKNHPQKEHFYEIQRFTGFHDRNGKRIFEGDIFEHITNGFKPIEWIIDQAKFVVWLRGARAFELFEFFKDLHGRVVDKSDWPEVVGNNFENPQLT